MTKRNYSNVAPPLPLGAAVNSSATTLQVTSTAGYPAVPFILALGRGTASEEVVLCTAKTSTTFTVTRGYDGTTAAAHGLGAMVEHTTAAIDYRESSGTPMTTAERNALSGADLWDGMFITNTTTDTIERWDGSSWISMARMGDVTTAISTAGAAKVDKTIVLTAGSGMTGGGDLSANRSFAVNFHSSGVATTVPRSDDARFSDARTPLAHSHAQSDITGLTSALGNKSDVGHTHLPAAITGFTGSGGRFWADDGTFKSVDKVQADSYKGSWASGTAYAAGDITEYGGRLIRAKAALGANTHHRARSFSYVGTYGDATTSTNRTLTANISPGTLKVGDLILFTYMGLASSAITPNGFKILGWNTPQNSSRVFTTAYRYATQADVDSGLTVATRVAAITGAISLRVYRDAVIVGGGGPDVGNNVKTYTVPTTNPSAKGNITAGEAHTEVVLGGNYASTTQTPQLDATTAAAAQNQVGIGVAKIEHALFAFDRPSTSTSWYASQQMSTAGASYWASARAVIQGVAETYPDPADWEDVLTLEDRTLDDRVQIFDVSGTWTKPKGLTRARFILVGGGGGGHNTGGGGGGKLDETLPADIIPDKLDIIVGAGGNGYANAVNATAGGSTTVGPFAVSTSFSSGAPTDDMRLRADGGGPANLGTAGTAGGAFPFWNGLSPNSGSGTAGASNVSTQGAGGGGRYFDKPNGINGFENLYDAGVPGSYFNMGGWNGLDGSDGSDGDIARAIAGSGGGGAGNGSNTWPGGRGGNGGKYGGGGGGFNPNSAPASATGGNGGQGGVAIICYFD